MSESALAERPVIAVGGAPSSGTTLVADLLDSVPGIACDPELGILASSEQYERWDEGFVAWAAAGQPLAPSARYAAGRSFFNLKYLDLVELKRDMFEDMLERSVDLVDFVDRYRRHREIVRGRAIEVLAEKTPTNIGQIERFLERFPNGLFVHVVRDPRGVVESLLRRGFGLAQATTTWMLQVGEGLRFHDHPRVMVVNYETVATKPFETIVNVAAKVGVLTTPEQVRDRFELNDFRSSLPRVESWRVSEYTGRADFQPPNMRPMITGWVERQALWLAGDKGPLTFVSSVPGLANRLGYPVRVIPKAKFSVDRLRLIFEQFSLAEGRFDDVFSVTDPRAVTGSGSRLSKAITSEDRNWLDTGRPWVSTKVLEQIGLQMSERRNQRMKALGAEKESLNL